MVLSFTAATTGQAQITGTLALGATRNVTVGLGTGVTFDLDIASAITGATFGVTANGAGRLQLSGATANTYTGLTTVTGGAGGGVGGRPRLFRVGPPGAGTG